MSEPKLWRYVVPSVRGEGWAIVLMDSSGYFSTVSDFGNYAYKWRDIGQKDFRAFLLNCRTDYLLGKLARRNVLDVGATVRAVRSHILSLRKDRVVTKDRAQSEWDRVEMIEDAYSFDHWASQASPEMFAFTGECRRMTFCSDALGFAKHIWPRFCRVLLDALKREDVDYRDIDDLIGPS